MSAAARRVVALAAMLQAVEAGAQAALMAPTEVLARQHAATLDRACWRRSASTVELLTGKEPAARRRRPWLALADGAARRSPSAPTPCSRTASRSRDLGLAVIDEQHRFGVGQRLDLVGQGRARSTSC